MSEKNKNAMSEIENYESMSKNLHLREKLFCFRGISPVLYQTYMPNLIEIRWLEKGENHRNSLQRNLAYISEVTSH